ncbi:hypothetical protein KV205_34310 [Streptomyces sp. SKN60]|nr:hypothetical protein [Streptomyces sp. SKN60]
MAALLARLLGLPLAPGSGRRRADTRPTNPTSVLARRREEVRPGLYDWFGPAQRQADGPRSPYGLGETLDGAATALIRPYLVALERQEERTLQRWRRLSLVLAADFGLDLDTRDIHAPRVAW